jgi:hypothetical protein
LPQAVPLTEGLGVAAVLPVKGALPRAPCFGSLGILEQGAEVLEQKQEEKQCRNRKPDWKVVAPLLLIQVPWFKKRVHSRICTVIVDLYRVSNLDSTAVEDAGWSSSCLCLAVDFEPVVDRAVIRAITVLDPAYGCTLALDQITLWKRFVIAARNCNGDGNGNNESHGGTARPNVRHERHDPACRGVSARWRGYAPR